MAMFGTVGLGVVGVVAGIMSISVAKYGRKTLNAIGYGGEALLFVIIGCLAIENTSPIA